MIRVATLAVIFLIKLCLRRQVDILQHVHEHYGEEGKRIYRRYENTRRKHEKALLDLSFLQKCKIYNTFPKFLQFKLYKKCLRSSAFYRSWQTKLLTHELSSKRKSVQSLSSKVLECEIAVKTFFSKLCSITIFRAVERNVEKFRVDTSSTHERKLRDLGIKNNVSPCNPDKIVFNFSSICLTARMQILLAYGLDFCLPIYKVDFYKYFLSFESLVSRIKSLNLDKTADFPEFMNQLHSLSFKYFYNFKSYKVFSAVFSKQDLTSLKQLASNKDIIVCKPDKGRGVVILDKETYISKMVSLISDRSKFELVSDSLFKYTMKIEDKINNFLRKLKNMNILSDNVYRSLYCSGSAPGILYGLPKIHKPDFASKFQFRPIFAAYNCPSFKIAKYLVPILAPLTTNNYTLGNSYSFVKALSSFKFDSQYYMTSCDVINLFHNIPLDETIDIILESLFSAQIDSFMGMTRNLFRTFLEYAVKFSFFIFDSELYKQTDGLGMGLPLAPTFANIFMSYHEQKWLQSCPPEFSPVFYRRYVDDTFIIFRHKDHAPLFLDFINRQHSNISFTMECENNNTISFLDASISKSIDKLDISVYRKPTFSGLGLSFFSFCASKFKINSIKSLLSRAYGICSTWGNIHAEFQFLRSFFHNNGYPAKLVESCIARFLKNKLEINSTVCGDDQQMFFVFPYFGHQSQKMKEEMSALFVKYFKDINFNVILVNNFKIGSFFNYKDKLPKDLQAALIYKFSCVRCTSEYIGSTTRTLCVRVAEHAGRSYRTGHLLASPSHSSIRDHALSCDSPIRLDNFSILGRCNNVLDLRILESLYIFKCRPTLNNMQSAHPLFIVDR